MKKTRLFFLLVLFMAVGFVLGLTSEGLINKSYAGTEKEATAIVSPEDNEVEVLSTGTTASAKYEIVYAYGQKYIIFSSGGDIEVIKL